MSGTDYLRERPIAPEAFRNAFLMPFLPKRGQRAQARTHYRQTLEPLRAQPGSADFKDGFAALFRETGETVEH